MDTTRTSEFRNILDSLPEKQPQSRLEPYGELIDGLRRRRRLYLRRPPRITHLRFPEVTQAI